MLYLLELEDYVALRGMVAKIGASTPLKKPRILKS